jgi:hypothetical protein
MFIRIAELYIITKFKQLKNLNIKTNKYYMGACTSKNKKNGSRPDSFKKSTQFGSCLTDLNEITR